MVVGDDERSSSEDEEGADAEWSETLKGGYEDGVSTLHYNGFHEM